MFELAKIDLSVTTFKALHDAGKLCIANFLKSDARERIVKEVTTMDKLCTFALTEPETGSNASGITTVAKKVDGGYLLNGRKMWSGSAHWVDYIVVFT